MWILLVENNGDLDVQSPDGKLPMIAEAGTQHRFLLSFKNASTAKTFVKQTDAEGAMPHMVVESNFDSLLNLAEKAGAHGILVDFDPATKEYESASIIPRV